MEIFKKLDELQKNIQSEEIIPNCRRMTDSDIERLFAREQEMISYNTFRIKMVYYKTLVKIISEIKEFTDKEWDYREGSGRYIHCRGETICKFINYKGEEVETYLHYKDVMNVKYCFKEIAPVFDALMKRTKDKRTKTQYMLYFYELLRKYIPYEYKIIEIFTRYSRIGLTLSQEELIEMRDIYIELSETKTPIDKLNIDFHIQ